MYANQSSPLGSSTIQPGHKWLGNQGHGCGGQAGTHCPPQGTPFFPDGHGHTFADACAFFICVRREPCGIANACISVLSNPGLVLRPSVPDPARPQVVWESRIRVWWPSRDQFASTPFGRGCALASRRPRTYIRRCFRAFCLRSLRAVEIACFFYTTESDMRPMTLHY